ncbi:MAG: hypothetical protein Q4D81_02355 [Eubacteriales bacterium]|nr:hypothetical protein [Eubacteriales bacterium]
MADIKGVTPPFIDEIAGLAGFIYKLRGGPVRFFHIRAREKAGKAGINTPRDLL